jgi:hypothetical protein
VPSTYTDPTSARVGAPVARPVGDTSTRCSRTASGSTAVTVPTATSRGKDVLPSEDTRKAAPHHVSSAPVGFEGRRHQASSPVAT